MKRYNVTLEAEERQHLHDLIAAGQAAARKLANARILLKADAANGGPPGRTGKLPTPWRSAPTLSSGSVSDSSNWVSMPPWIASNGSDRPGRSSSTVGPRPGSLPWPAPPRRKVG